MRLFYCCDDLKVCQACVSPVAKHPGFVHELPVFVNVRNPGLK
jgi:hypothetical protein